ncbi:hypothetical protein WJX81_008277 [Elliptochloris bilobata]|uniref:DNA/pantothenate metabolism flavoprotein C-terminal domain-containing protein n=1 Tax=Elliptochloris bilobata TaxID=381761 RepID=A0AAW1RM81_9CHLO
MGWTSEDFFTDSPVSSSSVHERVDQFIAANRGTGGQLRRPIVCVTSGGTCVPLERRCVRFIDNFSGGTRGALSTEHFLQAGYAVIFLNRKHSIQPFTKGLPSGQILDCLTQVLEPSAAGNGAPEGSEQADRLVRACVATAHEVAARGVLLRVAFETLFEYLAYLRAIAEALRPCGQGAAFYLAAAVSDFFIPWQEMAEHKIQSAGVGDQLHLTLQKTPKMLGDLRRLWAPEAFVISFKLETDENVLAKKAAGAIERYGVHAVVANILETRKDVVTLLAPAAAGASAAPAKSLIRRPADGQVIEAPLVAELARRHAVYWGSTGT